MKELRGGEKYRKRRRHVNRSRSIWLIKLASVYVKNRVNRSDCDGNGLCAITSLCGDHVANSFAAGVQITDLTV